MTVLVTMNFEHVSITLHNGTSVHVLFDLGNDGIGRRLNFGASPLLSMLPVPKCHVQLYIDLSFANWFSVCVRE